jgi:hypothetical protein
MKHTRILFLTVAVLFMISTVSAGLITPSPSLPPDGDYVSPQEYHEYAAAGIILDDPIHRPLADTAIRTVDGADELEEFDSQFIATEIGTGLGSITLTGPVTVRTTGKVGNTTGTFDTEMVSMSLSGGGVLVRQDPTRPTLGVTTITDIGGGLYQIDSFFDVFTELSVDSGLNWIPSDSSTHMVLVPEPATMLLLAFGGLLIRKRK